MNEQHLNDYSNDLGLALSSLELIKENKYCLIYMATSQEGPCIIKKYKTGDPKLAVIEAQALSFYHSLAQEEPRLIDSGEPRLKEEKRLLSMGFVEGDPFSEVLREARKDASLRKRCVRLMEILGTVLRTMHEKTQRPGEKTSPFIFEYFDYSSRRLEGIPVLGRLLFKGLTSEAKELAQAFQEEKIVPSFVHGDFVFKNIHVKDERVGLIDFANANARSHPLNDICNLWFALANMLLPKVFKRELLAGFFSGFGTMVFPEIAERFYHEYHRRRWLMLKLISRNPSDVAQGLRGLLTFAKPFAHGVVDR